jgi:hypothetical protein
MRKKINIIILFMMVAVFSCRKDHSKGDSTSPTNKAHTVKLTINTSGFSQSIGNNSKLNLNSAVGASDFKNYFDTLYINFANKIYTYSTKNLTAINIPSQELFPGTYTAYAFGGQKGMLLNPSYSIAYYSIPDISFIADLWKDSFAASQKFTISDADVTVNLNLVRINSAIEVVIQDAIPNNVSYITLNVSQDYNFYSVPDGSISDLAPFDDLRGSTAATKYTVADTSKGKSNFTMDRIMLNTTSKFDLTISAYNSANSLIAFKVVKDIKLTKNQKSILTGTLFGGSTSNSVGSTLPLTADTSWNSTPILKSF